jgi:hypothetical protein
MPFNPIDYTKDPELRDFLGRGGTEAWLDASGARKRVAQGLPPDVAHETHSDESFQHAHAARDTPPATAEQRAPHERVMPEMDLSPHERLMPEMDLTDPVQLDSVSVSSGQPATPPDTETGASRLAGAMASVGSDTANGLPVVHMPEDPRARMAPQQPQTTPEAPPAPPNAPTGRPGAPVGPPVEPSFNELAARKAEQLAFGRDQDNRARWALGEGLKQAFATASGNHYSPNPYPLASEAEQAGKMSAQERDALDKLFNRQRQGKVDELNQRKGESEITLNVAKAGEANRMPGPKAEGAPKPNPQAYKLSMKHDPLLLQQFGGDQKKLDAWVDAQDNDEKALADAAGGIRGQSKGVNIGISTAKAGLSKEENVKQAEERTKIHTARKQLNQVHDAFRKVSAMGVLKGKVGWDSPAMSEFRSSALALIDKMAQVETGATGRQSQVEQWKNIIEGKSVVSDAQMDGIVRGLTGALDAADEENEGRTEGLVKLRPDQPKAPAARPVTIRDTKTGEQRTFDAETARRILSDPTDGHEFKVIE